MTLRSALILTIATLAPAVLHGQGWSVVASAGSSTEDPVAARLNSAVASLGVEYADSAARWLYLNGGTPLSARGPAWGAGGVGAWLGIDRGTFTFGTSLAGHLFGYAAEDSLPGGGGGTVEVIPTLTISGGPFRAELGSGFVGTVEHAGGATTRRGVSESSARLIATLADGVDLSGEGRFLHAFDGDWPYAGGALQVRRERFGAWAYGGQWLRTNLPAPRTAYGVGASVRIRRLTLEAGVRQQPVDPVYFGPARRTWTVQLSQGFGRVPRLHRGPPPPATPPRAPGEPAVFRLSQKEYPVAPVLLGDFSQWQPVEMAAGRDGSWIAEVRLEPGVHHYAFRAADGTTFVPAGVPTVDDGFGGVSAVLVVP